MDSKEELVTAGLGYINNLAELIEYSPNSTVSKTLMRAEGVNVVLFSLIAEHIENHFCRSQSFNCVW